MNVKVFNKAGQLVGPIEMAKVVKTDAEWQKQLTPAQYQIARSKGTEPAFCGNLLDNKKHGVYACVCCGLPLFSSEAKFESGTGWPSFLAPIDPDALATDTDRSLFMTRTEAMCGTCGGHLGHVFDDGPRPSGLRYCINSASLTLDPDRATRELPPPADR